MQKLTRRPTDRPLGTAPGPLVPEAESGERRRERNSASLVPVDIALEKGIALARPVDGIEPVALDRAAGRVLGRALVAPNSIPHFSYSAMDGYAVATDRLPRELPARIPVTGRIAAGDQAQVSVPAASPSALRILTGAAIPDGADAVIRQEDAVRDGDAILVSRAPARGQNIRPRGEDAKAGDLLIAAGTLLGPREIGVAASAGCARLEVMRRIRVAIFSTGSELRQPGEPLEAGQIYNSNRFVLRSLLDRPWIELDDLGACPDDPAALREALSAAAARADVVVTTGGVSVGDEDHMPGVVRDCGGSISIADVAIKPGKPLTIGRLGTVLYIGLPGNPGAVFTTFSIIADVLLRARAGLADPRRPLAPALADFDLACRPGRRKYLPAVVSRYTQQGAPVLDLLPKSNSGRLCLLSRAEGFAVIGPERTRVSPGDIVDWHRLWSDHGPSAH